MAVGRKKPVFALLPALRIRQSNAEGAAQGLHSIVQRVGGVSPDGYQPGQHPSLCHLLSGVQAAAQATIVS